MPTITIIPKTGASIALTSILKNKKDMAKRGKAEERKEEEQRNVQQQKRTILQ